MNEFDSKVQEITSSMGDVWDNLQDNGYSIDGYHPTLDALIFKKQVGETEQDKDCIFKTVTVTEIELMEHRLLSFLDRHVERQLKQQAKR